MNIIHYIVSIYIYSCALLDDDTRMPKHVGVNRAYLCYRPTCCVVQIFSS